VSITTCADSFFLKLEPKERETKKVGYGFPDTDIGGRGRGVRPLAKVPTKEEKDRDKRFSRMEGSKRKEAWTLNLNKTGPAE